MKGIKGDAGMREWISDMNRRMERMERVGYTSIFLDEAAGATGYLSVNTMEDIPDDLPVGTLVLIAKEDRFISQDAVTMAWETRPPP